ncbi:hypothetical protein A2810_00125 [candidate division Kazan bacterium RIFCSPHIGHO2_01_FULL_49_10]|uniref:Uncharacterized protein n=1 Tax=candidate division Kazan bacterium RIFCSPLOWO2_01_FULL_48_13 TaxID=1798539 RepID=A0A1F4PPT5_UNCK3|nr:MAG: hypothetical protein A2810_00125 [candidate division Kazan bacterium RIFCSPHIGHO2_01_FULL_49_10]OGB85691.1 MAG: hypothetical protein A2994_02970 [candidate division Kazan bacterium RIFCSPLOWO2_01_FULL_48_13]
MTVGGILYSLRPQRGAFGPVKCFQDDGWGLFIFDIFYWHEGFQDDFFFVIARRQRSLVSLGTGSAISMSSFWGVKRLQNLVYDPRRGEDDDAG